MVFNGQTGMTKAEPHGLAVLEPQSFGDLERLSVMVAKSRLFAVQSPEAAVVIMLTGAQLGIPPVAAMRGIHVVEGRAVLSSDLIAAVILRSPECEYLRPVEVSGKRVTMTTKRRGQEPVSHTWTIEMAQTAELAGRNIWKKYPHSMLRARATAELGRMVYPELLFGVYVDGELDNGPRESIPAEVYVGDVGNRATEPAPSSPAAQAETANAPEGSRAFAAYCDTVAKATTATRVVELYAGLVADLREEGHDPAAWLDDGPDGEGAETRALAVLMPGYALGRTDAKVLLGDDGADVASLLDDARVSLRDDAEAPLTIAARWWIAHRAAIKANAPARADLVYSALARMATATLAGSAQATKGAKERLTQAVKALETQPTPPPTGTRAPAGTQPANGGALAHVTTATGEVLTTRDAMEAHVGGLNAYATQASYRRHRGHTVMEALLVEHYMAVRGIVDEAVACKALDDAARGADARDARKGREALTTLGIERGRRAA